MAGSLTVTCGECKKVMQVPEVLAGKRIRCRGCNATLTVTKPVPKAVPVKTALAKGEAYEQATAYGIKQLDETIHCAFCAADMEDDQIVCLKCGYNMQTRERHGVKVLHVQTGGDYFLWHLPAGFCVLLIMLCIAGIVIIWTGTPDLGTLGEYIQQWRWGAVYSSFFLAIIIYISGRFAIKRIIYNPHPPEVEKFAHEQHRDDD